MLLLLVLHNAVILVINDTIIADVVDCICIQEMPKNKPNMPALKMTCITGAEVRACKSKADVDNLLNQKFKKPEDTPILKLLYAVILASSDTIIADVGECIYIQEMPKNDPVDNVKSKPNWKEGVVTTKCLTCNKAWVTDKTPECQCDWQDKPTPINVRELCSNSEVDVMLAEMKQKQDQYQHYNIIG